MSNGSRLSTFTRALDRIYGPVMLVVGVLMFANGIREYQFGSRLEAEGQHTTAFVKAMPECRRVGMGGRVCEIDITLEAAGKQVQLESAAIDPQVYGTLKIGAPVEVWYLPADPTTASTRPPRELRNLGESVVTWACVPILLGLLHMRGQFRKSSTQGP